MEDNNVNNIIQNDEDKISIQSTISSAEGNLNFSQNRDETTGSGGDGGSSLSGSSTSGNTSSNSSGSESSQLASDNLTPILLILGDSPDPEPDVEEEPVLLEEDNLQQYTIAQNGQEPYHVIIGNSGCTNKVDEEHIIVIQEGDNIINNNNNIIAITAKIDQSWCHVVFEHPLNSPLQLGTPYKLNSDNFSSEDNERTIVPMITCEQNSGPQRTANIIFCIDGIESDLKIGITQNAGNYSEEPVIIKYKSVENGVIKYDILDSNKTYYIHKNSNYIFSDRTNMSENPLLFGLRDSNNNINGNLKNSDSSYTFESEPEGYNMVITDNNTATTTNTAYLMIITQPQTVDINQVITFKYNNIDFIKVKYSESQKDYKTSIKICKLENLQNYKETSGYNIYLFNSDIGTTANIKTSFTVCSTVKLHSYGSNDDISNGRIVACIRLDKNTDKIPENNISDLNDDNDDIWHQLKPVGTTLTSTLFKETYKDIYLQDWTNLKVYNYSAETITNVEENQNIYVYIVKDSKYNKVGVINFGGTMGQNGYLGLFNYYYTSLQACTYNTYWICWCHWYGDTNDSYYDNSGDTITETETINATFKNKQFGTFDLYFVAMNERGDDNDIHDIDIANKIINSGKNYKKYNIPSGTYNFNMNKIMGLVFHPENSSINEIKTFREIYDTLQFKNNNHYYDIISVYKDYYVIDLNNVCNDINGNIINLNEFYTDMMYQIYIFTKVNGSLIYIGILSYGHVNTKQNWGNIACYSEG